MANRARSYGRKSSRSVRRSVFGESLEPRWTPAWLGVPPTAITPPGSAAEVSFNSDNDATGEASIATSEFDYYSFTAPVTGSYRLSATTPSSNLDTVLGVFSASGVRLAYNDDISRTNYDSQLTINLQAGTRYYVGITNYGGFTRGSYTWTVDGPGTTTTPTSTIDLSGASLSVTNSTQWGQTITAQASVRNPGNSAAGTFTEQWYLSRDPAGSSDDILLSRTNGAGTSLTVAGVGAGSTTSTFNVSLQLPSSLPSGWTGSSFYLVMRTDAASQVSETNESNNFGQAGSGFDNAPITIGGTTQPGGFQITLNMTGLTSSQQTIFQSAANRWAQVITGDLPNATYRGQTVDDLLINASSSSIDGVGGILGESGPDAFRSGTDLPYHGVMQFDSADMASMESSGLLYSVVLHEMGHILGIGTIWEDKGLLSGAGTSNPIFTGAQATAAYNQIFGTNAAGVPVEATGGSGTRDAHWRETTLSSELMTGWAGPGTNLPLSPITAASLADLGYQVNMAAADTYTRSSSSSSSSVRSSASVSDGTSAIATLDAQSVDNVMAGLACGEESGTGMAASRSRHAWV